jgi:N-acetyl-anhydromuramyl-L-alanine amidase AmpD
MPIYSSIYDGPPNRYGDTKTTKKWIVIHNTSNDAPAVNEASYAKRRTDSVSSHYYVDGGRIIQSLNTDLRAFHVGSSTGNAGGIAYEITGTNAKSRSWWLTNVRWDLLAAQIRKDCAAHGITPRLLTVEEIKAGKTGIMTHDQARRAWGGTDHTDPGPGFPMDHLLAQVKGDTQKEDSMELTDKIKLITGQDVGYSDTEWSVGFTLASTHYYVLQARNQLAAALAAGKKRDEAILAKLAGADTKTILDAINRRAAEDANRDASLLAEVKNLASGGATADEIVAKLAERLAQ